MNKLIKRGQCIGFTSGVKAYFAEL